MAGLTGCGALFHNLHDSCLLYNILKSPKYDIKQKKPDTRNHTALFHLRKGLKQAK